jgi:hypothetical protein
MASRNLKLRAIENGIYDKDHLTRVRYEIPSDLSTTDMGNSYLSLRTTFVNGLTKTPIDTQQDHNEHPTYFMFGDGTTTYSPSCMFRTAKLFSKQTGQVIEELNYRNIATQTFKEYTTDFDNLASDTIESGMGIPTSKLNNLQSKYTLWTNENPVELHIPLKEIFPSLNTPAYQLSAVGGLVVDLEFDVTKDMIMLFSDPALIIPPPKVLTSGHNGFQTAPEEEFSWLVKSQVNSEFGAIEKPDAVPTPAGWDYSQEQYFKDLNPFPAWAGGLNEGFTDLELAEKYANWTTADIVELGLTDATGTPLSVVRMSMRNGAGTDVEDFPSLDKVMSVADGKLTLQSGATPVQLGVGDVDEIRFLSMLNLIKTSKNPLLPRASNQMLSFPQKTADDWTLLLQNKIKLTHAQADQLVECGLLSKVGNVYTKIANRSFGVKLQQYSWDTTDETTESVKTFVVKDQVLDITAVNHDVSNKLQSLPRKKAYGNTIKEVLDVLGTHVTIEVEVPLELGGDVGVGTKPLARKTIQENLGNNPPIEFVDSVSWRVVIDEVVKSDDPFFSLTSHYPSTDLAEMVLVQYPPTKSAMPPYFRTMSVEPFNIDNNFQQLVQNFMLEPNVYNAYVVIPADSKSLIGKDGNILQFRATIDEVDVVSRDVKMGVYPDSLYWDKLIDTFSNSSMSLKSINGIVNGVNERPVRVLPIRVYAGLVGGQVNFSNVMKRLQIRMEAGAGQTIQAGTAYLFKEKYKQM